MAEKFLILGANSFYGSNFAKLVREKGDEAIGLSRPEYDLLNHLEPLDEALAEHKPKYVVNFISMSFVAESWVEPEMWMMVNGARTADMISWLQDRRRHWERFIHVSTPEVYGSCALWINENRPFNPTTPYAVSRAAGDMMLKAYHKAYGFPALITRTANIYGPGQPEHRIIPKAFAYKEHGKTLELHGDGRSVRSFIHVRDACEATYLLAKKGIPGETYHISTRREHSIKEVVEMIGCSYKPAPDRLGKDHAYLLTTNKIRSLGWTDTITLEQGLEECTRKR